MGGAKRQLNYMERREIALTLRPMRRIMFAALARAPLRQPEHMHQSARLFFPALAEHSVGRYEIRSRYFVLPFRNFSFIAAYLSRVVRGTLEFDAAARHHFLGSPRNLPT
jgi:hypothetical protein